MKIFFNVKTNLVTAMLDNAQHKIINIIYLISFQICFNFTRLCSLMSAVEECQTSYRTENVCTAAIVSAIKKTKSIKILFLLTKSYIFV
jgi:hypothetical protein